jgi:hypothetical protein
MRGESIRRPLAVALLGGVLAISSAAAVIIGHSYEHDSEEAAAGSLRAAHQLFGALERSDVAKMDAALAGLQADEELRRAFLSQDREALQREALPRFQALRERDAITHMYFVGADRRVFLRVHKPDLFGDEVKRVTLARAVETGDLGAGLELGQTAFALRVVRPWVVDGRHIGYLELAEDVSGFLGRMKLETGNDLGILVRKSAIDRAAWRRIAGPARDTWDSRPDVVVVDTTTFSEGLIDFQGDIAALPAGGLVLEEELRDGRALIRGVFPIADAAGKSVGALAVLHDFTRMHDVLVAGRRRVLLLVLGMALLACAVVWAALEWFVLRRLRRALLEAEGRLGLPPAPGLGGELGRVRRIAEASGRPGPP